MYHSKLLYVGCFINLLLASLESPTGKRNRGGTKRNGKRIRDMNNKGGGVGGGGMEGAARHNRYGGGFARVVDRHMPR